MNTILLMLAVMGGLVFIMSWRRERQTELKLNREEMAAQRKVLEKQAKASDSSVDGGGYIKVEVPEEHQSLFHDFLKGFEDFASLQGYKVSFSADASSGNIFSFKFTILESGISVSTSKVKEDFNEYLRKVESGESLDEIPVLTTPKEHDLLLTKLKNRINFLQHNYKLSKNTIEYYERLLKSVPVNNGFQSAPPVIVQTGGALDSRTFSSNSAGTLIQGNQDNLTTISNDNSIKIADSFNQRKNQIEDISRLIELLKSEGTDDSSQKAAIELEKVKGELEDEDSPDGNRIEKWLKKADEHLDTAKKSKEIFDKAKDVYTSFNVLGWIDAISSVAS